MIFSIEALQANEGDALVLHYGPPDAPRFIVVDGGPSGVFRKRLKARLDALRRRWFADAPLPIELLIVTHSDDDHIRGVLDLFTALAQLDREHRPLPFRIKEVWQHTFPQLAGEPLQQISGSIAASVRRVRSGAARDLQLVARRFSEATAASIAQGASLASLLRQLAVPLNSGFGGGVTRENSSRLRHDFGAGLDLRLLAPSRKRVDALLEDWKKWLARRGSTLEELKELVAACTDRSVPNLSSIVVLAELGSRRALLTGDARGDDVLEGLASAGLRGADPLHLDLLKLPHHGSSRNVDPEFFRRVRADHYLVTGNGDEGNPEVRTLQMLTDARGGEEYTLHFTNREGRNELGPKLEKFFEVTERGKGRRYRVVYRDDAAPSLVVDLMDRVGY